MLVLRLSEKSGICKGGLSFRKLFNISKQSCTPSGCSCSFVNSGGCDLIDLFDHTNLGAIHISCLHAEKHLVSTPQTQRTCSSSPVKGHFCLKSDKTQNSFLWGVGYERSQPPPPESNDLRKLFQMEINGHMRQRQAVPIFLLGYVEYFPVAPVHIRNVQICTEFL